MNINPKDIIMVNGNIIEKQYKEIGKPKIIIYKGKEQIRRRRVPEDSKTKLLILLNNIIYFTYNNFII